MLRAKRELGKFHKHAETSTDAELLDFDSE